MLGLDYALIEAVTGVSKRQAQRIVSEEKRGSVARVQGHGRRSRPKILESEHLEVSNDSTAVNNKIFIHFFSS